jgi:hypothetical protein
MSYSRLTQLRLSLKHFRRSCTSTSNTRPTAGISQIAKLGRPNDKTEMEEKKEEEDRVTYELPKAMYAENKKTTVFQLFSS